LARRAREGAKAEVVVERPAPVKCENVQLGEEKGRRAKKRGHH